MVWIYNDGESIILTELYKSYKKTYIIINLNYRTVDNLGTTHISTYSFALYGYT